jgi:hypothetical protein
MEVRDPHKMMEFAANALTPEQKKTAFELAVEVALLVRNNTDDKKKLIDTLKDRLSIDNEFADHVTSNKIGIE